MTSADASTPVGIDVGAVSRWLSDAVDKTGGAPVASVTSKVRFERPPVIWRNASGVATGASWALRRPPTGNVLATAHDMTREHRVMAALAETDVPVPTMVGLCTDDSVNGADFYVMDWVDGHVVRSAEIAREFSIDVRRNMGRSVVENLAKIHQVDIDSVGLGDFAKRSGYLERQLRRWKGQVDATSSETSTGITEAFDALTARLPTETPTRLVHGDYRLDNTIVSSEGDVLAVLDWELTTLGDPLADLGAMLCYWTRPGDEVVALTDPPTLADGFLERNEVIELYESACGGPVGDVDYYHAFATWRLACILDGVVDRYRAGAMGNDDDFDPEDWAGQVDQLAQAALDLLRGNAD